MKKSTEENITPEEVSGEAEPMETEAAAPEAQEEASSKDTKTFISHLREGNKQLKAKGKEIEASQSSLESRLKDLHKGAKSPEPSEQKVTVTESVTKAVTAAAETVNEAL